MFLREKVVLSRIATREIALVEKPGSTCSLEAHKAKLRVREG